MNLASTGSATVKRKGRLFRGSKNVKGEKFLRGADVADEKRAIDGRESRIKVTLFLKGYFAKSGCLSVIAGKAIYEEKIELNDLGRMSVE